MQGVHFSDRNYVAPRATRDCQDRLPTRAEKKIATGWPQAPLRGEKAKWILDRQTDSVRDSSIDECSARRAQHGRYGKDIKDEEEEGGGESLPCRKVKRRSPRQLSHSRHMIYIT